MRYDEWQQQAGALRERAEQLTQAIVRRARREAEAAGLDPSIPFQHAHNAVVSRDYGHAWPEVDYSRARRVLWLEGRSFEPHRIVDRILARSFARVCR